jgi:hypothetical protein
MAFRKAKTEQAALKMGLYGPSGSGKTFTALLMAEGLAKLTGKRIAFVDTERGTDFYCMAVKDRAIHPQAFDFDALYTKSITEVLEEVKKLSPQQYSVLVLDSITHIWEAARNAYAGKLTGAGTIPFHAWGKIKKPYKDLINFLLSSPMHVIFCGRQGNEFEEDEDTGELKRVGVKMKAEGETPYEPHILIRMEAIKNPKSKQATVTAYAEKDRTGILAGKLVQWPNFENMIKPLLPYLQGTQQALMPDSDDVGGQDAEKLAEQEKAKIKTSERLLGEFQARIKLAKTWEELEAIGKELSPEYKKNFVQADLTLLREAYLEKQGELPKPPDKPKRGRPPKEAPVGLPPEPGEAPGTAPEAGDDTNEGEAGENLEGDRLADSDTLREISIMAQSLNKDESEYPKRFGVNKMNELTNREAGIILGELYDLVAKSQE